jgi:hypothetical protein
MEKLGETITNDIYIGTRLDDGGEFTLNRLVKSAALSYYRENHK